MNGAAEQFESITGWPLTLFLTDFSDFTANDFTVIQNYYTGLTNDASAQIARLNDLISRTDQLFQTVQAYSNFFTRTDFIQLFLTFEQIKTRLNTTKNLNKYLRSNRSPAGFEPNTVQGQYYTKQFQTLPDVARTIEGQDNFTDGWLELFSRNRLSMLDVDVPDGNLPMVVNLPVESAIGDPVQAVLGDSTGVKVLGRDVLRVLTIETNLAGFSDLKVLDEQETVRQAIDIVFGLRQGDYPYNPFLGYDQNVFIGNKASVTFNVPIAVRQWAQTVATDDTIGAFRIVGIRPDVANAALYVDIEVIDRYLQQSDTTVIF